MICYSMTVVLYLNGIQSEWPHITRKPNRKKYCKERKYKYVEYRLGHFCCNALTFIKSKNDKYYSLGLKNLTSPHSFKRCRQWHRRVGLGGVIDTIESTPQSYWFKLRSFIHTRLCGVSSDILKKICNFLNMYCINVI